LLDVSSFSHNDVPLFFERFELVSKAFPQTTKQHSRPKKEKKKIFWLWFLFVSDWHSIMYSPRQNVEREGGFVIDVFQFL
jgi:hypothetical protein